MLSSLNLHPVLESEADVLPAVHRVPCEAGDALGDDEVDGAGKRVLHHFVEAVALFRVTAGYAFVRIYRYEFPILAPVDVVRVIVHLRLVAALLLLMVGGDAGISRNPALFVAAYRCSRVPVHRGRYRDHALCHFSALPS